MPSRLRFRLLSLPGLAAICVAAAFPAIQRPASAAERPNVLLILADDLGYSDLGCYGGEIQTPNLDRLAGEGLRFTQFYNTARCWPTRASLLTGFYAQQVRRDTLPGIPSGASGQRPQWAPLLAERLQKTGYRTYHSGKWHLDGMPLENGFDRSYYLRDQGRFFNPRVHYLDDQQLPAVEPGSGFYGTTAIADHTIRCLREHAEDHGDQPFFQYLAFTAPHFPLHALPEDIARYRDTYRGGWDDVRAARWQRIQQMGLVEAELPPVERELGPPYDFPKAIEQLGPGEVNRPLPWDELTDAQQEFQAAKMAIHAAMVDRMDREIGRVVSQLRAMNALENTLILFLSDNGASAEIMVRDDGHDPSAPPGSAATYLSLGPGWSTAANTPFRRHKTWVHEGGISTPLIAHWPAGLESPGELCHQPGHVIDVLPTIMQLAGHPLNALPADSDRPGSSATPQPPGNSFLPALQGNAISTAPPLWWLHEGNRAIRDGRWKLVAAKGEPWELYDVSQDRTETNDLAATHPEQVRILEAKWNEMLDQFTADAAATPSAVVAQHQRAIAAGAAPADVLREAQRHYQHRPQSLRSAASLLVALDEPSLRKQHLDRVVDAADRVVALVQANEFSAQERDAWLAEALYRKGRALGYMELSDVLAVRPIDDPQRHNERFEATFRQLDALVDTTEPEFILLRIRRERRRGNYEEALRLLEIYRDTASDPRWYAKKRRDIRLEAEARAD